MQAVSAEGESLPQHSWPVFAAYTLQCVVYMWCHGETDKAIKCTARQSKERETETKRLTETATKRVRETETEIARERQRRRNKERETETEKKGQKDR